jgi:SAM-dependent methyltransferase
LKFEILDAAAPLSETVARNPAFMRSITGRLPTRIAVGDGMFKSKQPMRYLKVGREAITAIQGMLKHRVASADVASVLDYAGGYGRVTRWLVAAFPEAKVVTADTDVKAMEVARELFGVEAHVVDKDAPAPLGQFDLIWSGSLFTHLPPASAAATLRFLSSQLAPRGTLVFSTHGRFVARRVQQREKMYHLDDARCDALLDGYARTGFGYSDYPGQDGYGIALTSNACVLGLIEDAGLEAIGFSARGWCMHQDVWAAQKLGSGRAGE